MISFIVSAFDRLWPLRSCLASLMCQGEPFEVIVTCNSLDPKMIAEIQLICQQHKVLMIPTGEMGATCPYSAAEKAVEYAKGDWLCFPSDDSYYLPRFSEFMLRAAQENQLDLVLSEAVVYAKDRIRHPNYVPHIHTQQAQMHCVDKTAFIVKKSWFEEFPGKIPHQPVSCDGLLIESLRQRNIRFGAAPGVLVVHN